MKKIFFRGIEMIYEEYLEDTYTEQYLVTEEQKIAVEKALRDERPELEPDHP